MTKAPSIRPSHKWMTINLNRGLASVFLDRGQLRDIERYDRQAHWAKRNIENFICTPPLARRRPRAAGPPGSRD